MYRPYCIAAYLCNMGHLSRSARMSLESKWRRYNKHQIDIEGRDELEARIEQGERIMVEHNQGKPAEQRIRMVVTIKRIRSAES